jgi:transposase
MNGVSTVTGATRGYDAGKKVSGRKCFGIVDTLGLLVGVVILAASASDNQGGTACFLDAWPKSTRWSKVFCDGGFKKAFKAELAARDVSAEVVNKIHPGRFDVLPSRRIVERTWAWLMNNRRLQVDYERDPSITESFVWAAYSRLFLLRLTQNPPPQSAA